MIVLFFLNSIKVSNILFSVSESKELVASSKSKISGSLYSARAIPILCFSPPEILTPLSPTFEEELFFMNPVPL